MTIRQSISDLSRELLPLQRTVVSWGVHTVGGGITDQDRSSMATQIQQGVSEYSQIFLRATEALDKDQGLPQPLKEYGLTVDRVPVIWRTKIEKVLGSFPRQYWNKISHDIVDLACICVWSQLRTTEPDSTTQIIIGKAPSSWDNSGSTYKALMPLAIIDDKAREIHMEGYERFNVYTAERLLAIRAGRTVTQRELQPQLDAATIFPLDMVAWTGLNTRLSELISSYGQRTNSQLGYKMRSPSQSLTDYVIGKLDLQTYEDFRI
jgi:hypothetical protein